MKVTKTFTTSNEAVAWLNRNCGLWGGMNAALQNTLHTEFDTLGNAGVMDPSCTQFIAVRAPAAAE